MKKFLTLTIVLIFINPFVVRADESSSTDYVTVGGVVYFVDENEKLISIPSQLSDSESDDDDDDTDPPKPLIPQNMRKSIQ